jgi:hypothetical protein
MSNLVPYSDQEKMANAIAKSGLFGLREPNQVLALMAVAQAEGRHPASVAKDYHIIEGRPALKADAMLARFQMAGGSVEWLTYTDEKVEAIFSHPQGGRLQIAWTIKQANQAGISMGRNGMKDNWAKYPRAMLRARVISEGIRTVFPGVIVGEYTPEEVSDFKELPPAPKAVQHIEIIDELVETPSEWNLYVPAINDTVELYKGCADRDEYMAEYADLVAKVHGAKKLTDEEKEQKLKLLEEANIETLEKIRNGA